MSNTEISVELSGVPYIEQYVGAWAMDANTFAQLKTFAESKLMSHLSSDAMSRARDNAPSASDLIEIQGNVGILNLHGVLMKQSSSMFGGTSTVLARRALRQLVDDDQIEKILLRIESPGGTARGTAELGDDIRKAGLQKPVTAFIEDLGASAAYWLASQASEIHANSSAQVGSIGTYMVVNDFSAMNAQQGITTHVVRAGEYKGMLAPGTKVEQEHLSELQRMIDHTNQFFLDAVAEGRGMTVEAVRQLADGRTHFAKDAQSLGLIDGVSSFENVLASLRQSTETSNDRSRPMSSDFNNAAGLKEIKANCPGISSDKILEYMDSGKTLVECQSDWMQELAIENAALSEQVEELTKAKAEVTEQLEAEQSAPGVDALEETPSSPSSEDGTATEEFNSLVKEKVSRGMDKRKAIASVVSRNPELHQEYLAEVNAR